MALLIQINQIRVVLLVMVVTVAFADTNHILPNNNNNNNNHISSNNNINNNSNNNKNNNVVRPVRQNFKKSLLKDCSLTYSPTCFKIDVLSWIEKLNEEDTYSVMPGISVVREQNSAQTQKNTSEVVAELARNFPYDVTARLDAFLVKQVTRYLNTHSIRLSLWQQPDDGANEVGTGRGDKGGLGGKKGGGLASIVAAAVMMKGTLFTVALGGLAAIASKALMTGLISLLLSAIIGLKSLTSGHKQTTYEVISKPVYTHSNTHSTSHEEGGHYGGHIAYGRNFDVNPPELPLSLRDGYKVPK